MGVRVTGSARLLGSSTRPITPSPITYHPLPLVVLLFLRFDGGGDFEGPAAVDVAAQIGHVVVDEELPLAVRIVAVEDREGGVGCAGARGKVVDVGAEGAAIELSVIRQQTAGGIIKRKR